MARIDAPKTAFRNALRLSAAFAASLAASSLSGQQADLQFGVASIRPTTFASDAFAAGYRAGAARNPCGAGRLSISGTLVTVTTTSICGIIRIAYDLKDYQVTGMPAGLNLSDAGTTGFPSADFVVEPQSKRLPDFFEIMARSPGSNVPTEEQARSMLRALLRDRFRLVQHRETRELPFYALVAAKGGPKLTPAVEGCKPAVLPSEMIRNCGQTTQQIARYLSAYTDRRVVDMTGIPGKFDYEIPLDLSRGSFNEAMLAAIQAELKLKLEPRKGPDEVLVVDRVERPSAN